MLKKYQHIIYGILVAFVGLLVWIYYSITKDDYDLSILYATTLGGFLSGTLLWYLVIMRRNINNYYEAITAGVLTGSVSHWFCWCIMFLTDSIQKIIFKGASITLLLFAPFGAIATSFISLLLYGVYTVIGGVILAVLLKYVIIKQNKIK